MLELKSENAQLLSEVSRLQGLVSPCPVHPPRAQILYAVTCDCGLTPSVTKTIFRDLPEITDNNHLQGRTVISSVETYLRQNNDIVLVVYKNYICSQTRRQHQRGLNSRVWSSSSTAGSAPVTPAYETFSLVSHKIYHLFHAAISGQANFIFYPKIEEHKEVMSPYVFYFHDRQNIKKHIEKFDTADRRLVVIVTDYLDASFDEEYRKAEGLFDKGTVSWDTVQYLFQPNRVIVTREDGEPSAFVSSSYLTKAGNFWTLSAWSWDFDGRFWKKTSNFKLSQISNETESTLIKNLDVFPLQYANDTTGLELRARGERFWQCRNGKYVACCQDTEELRNVGVPRTSAS